MNPTRKINIINRFDIGGNERFVLIAGPCAIESEEMTLRVAAELKQICSELHIHLIFKSSFDKANRSSVKAPRGVGMEKGLQILKRVKDELQLPIVTDVHESWQCEPVAKVADIIQIPAFLSRQTDLLIAAAKTGKVVNVKKGQFMAPWDMKNVIDKMTDSGNENILLCERGSCFGYNNLIVDMTGLVEMRSYGFPVVFDATHAVQKPGGQGTSTGGNREMVPYLMRAALAVGVDAIFAEVHPDPEHAFSDGPNQIHLSIIRKILEQAIAIDDVVKGNEKREMDTEDSEMRSLVSIMRSDDSKMRSLVSVMQSLDSIMRSDDTKMQSLVSVMQSLDSKIRSDDSEMRSLVREMQSLVREMRSDGSEIRSLVSEMRSESREMSSEKWKTKNEKPGIPEIKLFLTDVDGVLTDAGMYYSENGDELKKFNTHDGMGLQIIKNTGIKTGIITSEDTHIVERRFNKLKLDYLCQGKREGGKLASVLEICEKEGITLGNVAYIGDDINCLELLSNVGLAACPANAISKVKEIPGILHLSKKGGEGCVRELIEIILERKQ